jgi:CheY-like chemotaxis protein
MAASPRILIIDDEPQILTFLSLTFEHAGYSVRTPSNGSDAIARCSDEPFDVVLSDVRMLSVAVDSPSTRHEVPMRKLTVWRESSGPESARAGD